MGDGSYRKNNCYYENAVSKEGMAPSLQIKLLLFLSMVLLSISILPLHVFAEDAVTIPVYWCREDENGKIIELTDEEARWFDDNRKTTASLEIPSSHSVLISKDNDGLLWTPYTLPKVSDDAEGYPLAGYAIGKNVNPADGNLNTAQDTTSSLWLMEPKNVYLKLEEGRILMSEKEDMSSPRYYEADAAFYVIYRTQKNQSGGPRLPSQLNLGAYILIFAAALFLIIAIVILRVRRKDDISEEDFDYEEDPEDPESM